MCVHVQTEKKSLFLSVSAWREVEAAEKPRWKKRSLSSVLREGREEKGL